MATKKESTPSVRVRVSLSLKPDEAALLKRASGSQHPTTFAKWAALLMADRVISAPLARE